MIERKLWYESTDGRVDLAQTDLIDRTEPLIILGEAGMGKTILLDWIAESHGVKRRTARQLINCYDPTKLLGEAEILVIDALDEVSSQTGGDAVDRVLYKLSKLGCPRFVLSSRVADWRSATGTEAIREQYQIAPIELHLQPFDERDISTFLSNELGEESADRVITHFRARSLDGLLGNPQTLDLIAKVASTGSLPDTKTELFERAIEEMWGEARDAKAEVQFPREVALDTAGAAFAALILTGSEALVRKAAANVEDGELSISEVCCVPGAEQINVIVGSRLFRAMGSDRFSYWHRSIGEFLGARWLGRMANSRRKRKRLLSLFRSNGVVPASLRGIHAWLALIPSFAEDVIAADPMGVIEYGDADNLPLSQARLLLQSLERLSEENPDFRGWGPYSLRSITQPGLEEELRRIITAQETPFPLRLLILETLDGTDVARGFKDELKTIVLDSESSYGCRRVAGEALIRFLSIADWHLVMLGLRDLNDEDSLRLSLDLIDKIGYESFDVSLLVDLSIAYVMDGDRVIGPLYHLERNLPDCMVGEFLSLFSAAVGKLGKPYERSKDMELSDLAYHLIGRRVENGDIASEQLWRWLEPFHHTSGYRQENRAKLEGFLRNDNELRQLTQSYVLLTQCDGCELINTAYRMSRRCQALYPSAEDVIALLGVLETADSRWRELIRLAPHDGEVGADVRAATHRFTLGNSEAQAWVEQLAIRTIPKWEVEEAKRQEKERIKREVEFSERRASYTERIKDIFAGEQDVLVGPALAYLNLVPGLPLDALPHRRIHLWLGDELGDAAIAGFDTFITSHSAQLTPEQVAVAIAQSECFNSANIFVAALAERFRQKVGFAGISNEKLLVGLFELRKRAIESHAGIEGLEDAIEGEVKARGIWPEAMRLYHEPQIEAHCDYVDGLSRLLKDSENQELAALLSADWLQRFSDMSVGPESEMIDCLLRAGKFDELRHLPVQHGDLGDTERQRNWDVVALIVDFEKSAVRLNDTEILSEFLWNLRDRTLGRYDEGAQIELAPQFIEWVVETFRYKWPFVERQRGPMPTMGNTRPWDATDYLVRLIYHLGKKVDEVAVETLKRLRESSEDGYTRTIQVVISEQRKARGEFLYKPPTLSEITAITQDAPPQKPADLQAFVLEELEEVQAKIKSDDVESWRGFFDSNGSPLDEEPCRDHLIILLRGGSKQVAFDPEVHVASDKRVDIACIVDQLRMPIEVKGQWHPDLWHAADGQLDAQYTPDWRADGRGIYLVLWFGDQVLMNKKLKSPGAGKAKPKTPNELADMLKSTSKSAAEGRVEIFVLDLTRL